MVPAVSSFRWTGTAEINRPSNEDCGFALANRHMLRQSMCTNRIVPEPHTQKGTENESHDQYLLVLAMNDREANISGERMVHNNGHWLGIINHL